MQVVDDDVHTAEAPTRVRERVEHSGIDRKTGRARNALIAVGGRWIDVNRYPGAEPLEHLEPRPKRRRPLALPTTCPRNRETFGTGEAGCLLGEPRLADARLARYQNDPARPTRCIAARLIEHQQLAEATDERVVLNCRHATMMSAL
ncbi:MAG TPA: hypothetical protein VIA11_14770 [Acidimicrobiia bacterium]|nr:hypothetical protein [Acidimicrobiia bacterium]